MKRYFGLLILFIFLCIQCSSHNKETYTEIYNLNLRNPTDSSTLYQWRINPRYYANPYTFFWGVENNPPSIQYYSTGYSPADQLQSEIAQRILLPLHSEKDGMVKLSYKSKNIESAYMVMAGIDKQEQILYSDTLHLIPDTNIVSLSRKIHLQQAELMDLKIFVRGEEKGKNAAPYYPKLEVSSLDIFIGKKHIDQYPVRKLSFPFSAGKTLTIPINGNDRNSIDRIEALKRKKIVGFGESVHHNMCVTEMISQLIMHRVREGECRLVILEQPMEKVLHYNYYIQHKDAGATLDDLHSSPFTGLLEQLREYNLTKEPEDRVLLFGMDYVYRSNAAENSAITIFDYISNRNKKSKIKLLDEFALLLADYTEPAVILSYLKKNRELLEEHLSREDYKCISHILNLSCGLGENNNERNYMRDSVMYLNTRFIMDNFCPADKQAIIYGHTCHLNPVSTYPSIPCQPLGYYLRKWYKEDYSSLLFTIGTGFAEATGITGVLEEKGLMSPPEGSMESFLNSYTENVVYLPLNKNFNILMLSRNKGNRHVPQEFFPYNFYQRHAGVVFIKECTEKSGKEDVIRLKNKIDSLVQSQDPDPKEMDRLFNKIYGEANNRVKEREELLHEIKKRLNKYQ
ncbi:erythromycin esterase family protein [uncultured Proteiniphilum sp.]|uniref:erythromycin esterase family protein n=1 Tax=uncultured Proteiniphilum sp. TaxID=497637 RepID=UPI0026201EEE|nr:erythromycin esterase family protein [uncultured Proteiniphilum sp.]